MYRNMILRNGLDSGSVGGYKRFGGDNGYP